jgi:hypothetical protein
LAIIDEVFLAILTRNTEDAGTESTLHLNININGSDVVDHDLWFEAGPFGNIGGQKERANAGIGIPIGGITPFESNGMTNSSVQVGIRGDDAWAPRHLFLIGREATSHRYFPLAIETDLNLWLSTDTSEGDLTTPIRLVRSDTNGMIRRALLLIQTAWDFSGDLGTDDPIELEIMTAGGNIVLSEQIHDSVQADLEQAGANWYVLPARVPFNRLDVQSIKLRIIGQDAWVPAKVFVYGFDTTHAQGRPNNIMRLSAIPNWDLGQMSADPSEDPLKGIRVLPRDLS